MLLPSLSRLPVWGEVALRGRGSHSCLRGYHLFAQLAPFSLRSLGQCLSEQFLFPWHSLSPGVADKDSEGSDGCRAVPYCRGVFLGQVGRNPSAHPQAGLSVHNDEREIRPPVVLGASWAHENCRGGSGGRKKAGGGNQADGGRWWWSGGPGRAVSDILTGARRVEHAPTAPPSCASAGEAMGPPGRTRTAGGDAERCGRFGEVWSFLFIKRSTCHHSTQPFPS